MNDSSSVDVIRALAMAGLSDIADFATALNRSSRTVYAWIAQGMPVQYIGNKAYVETVPAIEWVRTRRQRNLEPRRPGRPRKRSA